MEFQQAIRGPGKLSPEEYQKVLEKVRQEEIEAAARGADVCLEKLLPNETAVAMVVRLPEKTPVEVVHAYRDGLEEMLDNHDVNIPVLMLCGDIQIKLLKVPKAILEEFED